MPSPQLLTLEFEGAIARIGLARPQKLNAINQPMLHELRDALAAIESAADCRAVILYSHSPKAFSAGGDIAAWGELSPQDMAYDWIRDGNRVFDRLAALRAPTIAALGGLVFGGGLELALACDLRLCTPESRFASPEVTVATVPGWGMLERLPVAIGLARARQMLFTGTPIDARCALDWGLVTEVVAAESLLPRATALAEAIAANAPVSVQATKQALALLHDRQPIGPLESLLTLVTATTEDAAEGKRAFAERRRPNYRGR